MTPDPAAHVWYTSYGSNCSRERFLIYLRGGLAPGSDDPHLGARDSTDPLADGAATLPTNVCFAGHSKRWDGAPAFLEHRAHPTGALGRRYLITFEQFADVFAQENRRRPGDIDVPGSVGDLAPGERLSVIDSAYGAIVGLDPVDGHPSLTFTSPVPPEDREPAAPSATYLATIVHGLHQVHDLDAATLTERLHGASGVSPVWTRDSIAELLRRPLEEIFRK